MEANYKQMAMVDIAELILRNSDEPMTIQDLLKEVAKVKEISTDDIDRLTQLYLDITLSAKFVFIGDDKWDLKERNLEYWDKDGYAFVTDEEIDEEDADEELDFQEFVLEDEDKKVVTDEDEEVDEHTLEESAYIAPELPILSTDDEDVLEDDLDIEFDDDEYNEEDYNEIMDDYEDMYDE